MYFHTKPLRVAFPPPGDLLQVEAFVPALLYRCLTTHPEFNSASLSITPQGRDGQLQSSGAIPRKHS